MIGENIKIVDNITLSNHVKKITGVIKSICIGIPFFILCMNNFTSKAQNAVLDFQHIDIQDGLSQSTVYVSLQDDDGFMWFGTRDGLNKYDGYNFRVFRKEPTDFTNLNTVRTLASDGKGDLWMGTDGNGLYRYIKEDASFEYIEFENDKDIALNTANILSLLFTDKSTLLIGTRNQGLHQFDVSGSKFTRIANGYGQIWDLAIDNHSESVWAGTDRGLLKISSDGSIQPYMQDKRIQVVEQHDDQIFVGSYQQGLYRFNEDIESITKVSAVPPKLSIYSLLVVNDHLWIGSKSEGLYIYDLNTHNIDHYASDAGNTNLKDNSIRSLFEDRTGTVWVGTNNAGLYTWSKYRSKFALYQHNPDRPNSLNNNVVLSFTEDLHQRLLVATEGGGINILDPQTERFAYLTADVMEKPSINNNHIITMMTDSNGHIWIGTDGGGLNKWNQQTGRFSYYRHDEDDPKSISNNSVLTLLEDSKGNIWIGTYRGLNRLDPDREIFHRYTTQEHGTEWLSDDRILALHEDSYGYIWVGTYAGGLNRIDPKTGDIKHFEYSNNDEKSISSNRVQSIYEDEKQDIWIGTYKGLNRFDRDSEEFTVFTTADGLANNVIYGVLADEEGYFWLSTNGGISRFNPETKEVLNFSEHDGLQSREFNGGAYFKSSSGELFFGGVNGFNIIDPKNIPLNKHKPPVEITSFEVNNDTLIWPMTDSESLNLNYDQNFFSIEFTALDYVVPESNLYRYKLKNFDKNWIEMDSRNVVRYTNVPPGEYTFEVQAANSDYTWNRDGVSLSIVITPPIWQRWWFQILVLISIIGFCYGLYRYRINALLRVQQARRRIASDLHDEIGATLSSISYFAQAIRQVQNEKNVDRFVELISESTYEAKEKITDIIWSIDPDNDDWINLLSKCRRFASDLFESKDIDYELNIATDINHSLDVELRQHLWLIFKEMTVNAARHSKAQKVEITFGVEDNTLRLVVQDNGVGIKDEKNDASGHGLKNIRQRAKKIGAELNLITGRRIGTRWVMKLKL